MPDSTTYTMKEGQGHFELVGVTGTLLREIANPKMYRNDIAQTYAFGILSSEEWDVKKVNAAIVERWGKSALRYIKERAWKLVALKIQERKEGENEDA